MKFISKSIVFSNYYKKLTIISFLLIVLSVFVFFFKGLNLGVDFKGGTLIELRVDAKEIGTRDIRGSFSKLNLSNVSNAITRFILI